VVDFMIKETCSANNWRKNGSHAALLLNSIDEASKNDNKNGLTKGYGKFLEREG
jgi:hypothetical protein